MSQENKEDKVVIGTITTIGVNWVMVACKEWGDIVIERYKNWDGGVDWEGFVKKLKPNNQIDLLRTNSDTKKPSYGFYTLGSLVSSPANENAVHNDKVMAYINRPQQEAFVRDVYHTNMTRIECWSPVWKKIILQEEKYVPVQRGDTLILSRSEIRMGKNNIAYKYNIVENKTVEDATSAWMDKTLSDFTAAERNKILIESDLIRRKEAENNR